MATKKEIRETLKTLNKGKFHIECPSCCEEINLKNAGLFHLNDFTQEAMEVYKKMMSTSHL